ncbi:MAG: hypothetical protein Q4C78_01510 [Synergistaceae bacterium]|nr:hypothetical protein [Synergistaceae bacterium]
MRFLLFMLLGTLLFGFAFPSVVLLLILLPVALLFIILLIGLITGRGTIIINDDFIGRYKKRKDKKKKEKQNTIYDVPHDRDEHKTHAQNHAVSIAELQEASEVIELDNDALKKE